jgi:Apea-like HEPN
MDRAPDEDMRLPALAMLVEGAFIGEALRVGAGKSLVLLLSLSDVSPGSEQHSDIQNRIASALDESCKKWEYLPQMGQMSNPLLALIPIEADSKQERQGAIARAERALDILHFRTRAAFSNYLRLVAHHAEDGSGVGVLISPDFSIRSLPGPARLVPPAIRFGYPVDLFDKMVGKIGDDLDLTEIEAALLNVLAWWRRAKQETNPTYKFAFLWFAIESGIPTSERDEGSFRRRIGMLAGYPTDADVSLVEGNPKAAGIYQNRDFEAGRTLRALIKSAYRMRCDIVHQGASHTSALAANLADLEQVATLFSYHLVPTLASTLTLAVSRGISDVADAWANCAVDVVFSQSRGKEDYAPRFLANFDLESSRLFRW